MLAPWLLMGLRGGSWLTLLCASWLILASAALLFLADGFGDVTGAARLYAWASYAPKFGFAHLELSSLLVASAALASTPFAVLARMFVARGVVPLPLAHRRWGLVRAASDVHGHADYMSARDMQALFPSTPDPVTGGVVVGECVRMDLSPVAHLPFEPELPETWGDGGRAPLLIDPCKRGSTHSLVIGGGGTYKSSALVTTLLTWRGSIVCLDPACELAAIVGDELRARRRRVVCLGIGEQGPNVLSALNPRSPSFDSDLRGVVGRIIGPMPGDDKARFKKWGRTIITALLAHLVCDPAVPPELKTLRALRRGLEGGEELLRARLRGIADHSPSTLARSLAATMWDMTHETFSGAMGNATDDTEWLATDVYADLVSGGAYPLADLAAGDLAVFVQVPQRTLEHTPALARVLIGCHLDAVFDARAKVKGRVFFPIDEAVLLGAEPALKVARDQGRKYRITLQLFYQSEGQIDEVWTPAGKRAWFDGVSWRTYCGVQNLESARELSAVLGTYGVVSRSTGTNKGRSGKGFVEPGSRSSGSTTSESEVARELAKPAELLADFRDDERLTLVRNRRPIRHGAAIAFRRPELAPLLGRSDYQNAAP